MQEQFSAVATTILFPALDLRVTVLLSENCKSWSETLWLIGTEKTRIYTAIEKRWMSSLEHNELLTGRP
jgi:hypothetical protein